MNTAVRRNIILAHELDGSNGAGLRAADGVNLDGAGGVDYVDFSLPTASSIRLVLGSNARSSLRVEFSSSNGRTELSIDPIDEPPVNLLHTSAAPEWTLAANRRGCEIGVNFRPQWSLPGEDTAFLRTNDVINERGIASAAFKDPITGGFTPVRPCEHYVFSLLGAAHRCRGVVRLSLLDENEQVLQTYTVAFLKRMPGGTERARYEDVRLEFVTPPGAAWLSIVVEKRAQHPAAPDDAVPKVRDSLLFFAEPALVLGGGPEGPAVRLPPPILQRFRTDPTFKIRSVDMPLPAEILGNGPIDVTLTDPRQVDLAKGMTLPNEPDIRIRHLALSGSTISLAGEIIGASNAPRLAAFVDGAESGSLAVELAGRTIFARGELQRRYLDGQRHTLEIRELPDLQVLASRTLTLGLPENGGAWAERIAEADAALSRARSEIDLLRNASLQEKAAAAKLRDRLGQLNSVINEINADMQVAGQAKAPFAFAPAAPSANPSRPTTREEAELNASPLFDRDWYARTYLQNGDESPARHYINSGAAAGAAPHPLFHAEWYRQHYMPASKKDLPFLHFLRNSTRREVSAHPLFDHTWFAKRYERTSVIDCMVFFQTYAVELDLDSHPLFDSRWYLETYPAVRETKQIPVHHYMTEGAGKNHWPNPLFDPVYYTQTYGAQVASEINPLIHFIQHGSDEGLNPNQYFSTAWYRASNQEVVKQHWIPLAHYLRVGGPDGRDPSLSFKTADYQKAHADFDIKKETALAHALRSRVHAEPGMVRPTRVRAETAVTQPSDGIAAPAINWVIGLKSNLEWAYGNNAMRFASQLPGWRHEVSGTDEADIVLYFDALVAERFPAKGQRTVLRVGGPRPLDRLYGDDPEQLRSGIQHFDAVITLSPSLQRRVSAVHPNAIFLPNGLDLERWSPASLVRTADRLFTAGFAGSVGSSAERDIKGVEIAIAAAERAGIPLVLTHKGLSQVPHERMIEDFYSRIDVLLQPVGPGREGCSNVIMEAISLGLPVITTVDSGFHGESLLNGSEALIRSRNVAEVADALVALRDIDGLAAKIGENARIFAMQHHDIGKIAASYEDVFRKILVYGGKARTRNVAFFPFWKPVENFASSRLRSDFPSSLVSSAPTPILVTNEDTDADLAIVVQSAEQPLFDELKAKPETFLIYDVCDRYFEDPKLFKTPSGEVNSLIRFNELVERANTVIAPTIELKAELASRFPAKPVFYVPEMIDYSRGFRDANPVEPKRVLWFGSPQRGNFDSARWMLDAMADSLGYEMRLVTRRGYFSRLPAYAPFVVDWSMETFLSELAAASLCIVAHAEEEKTKSANRFVTAVAHGVPTIVANSRPSAALLRAAGCGWAVVSNLEELERAVLRLEDPAERRTYLQRVQTVLEAEHGNRAVREAYLKLFLDRVYDTKQRDPRRIGFVTHNLNFGEGAPKSLFELVLGLRKHAGIEPFVYCTARGELADAYAKAGVPVKTFSEEFRPPIRVLNERYDAVRRDFKAFLEVNKIEYVIANTIKSASFATFAHEMNVPSSIIIRESFVKERRFDYFLPPPRQAAERGLLVARNVVFVSSSTSRFWSDQPKTPDIRLIKNGVDASPYADVLNMDKAEARSRLGLAEADIVAICVGTINARKGQHELLNWYMGMAPELRDRLTILFVGATDNKSAESFRAKHSELTPDMQARIIVVSTTPEIGLYYRASDLFLMNSSQESYPRSTMEALLFGLPVISTPVFGVLEQVVEGENGFIYEHDDMDKWQDSVRRLVLDADLRNSMSATAASSFWKLTTYAEMLHDYRCIIAPPEA